MSVLRSVLRPLARSTRAYATEAVSPIVNGFVGAVGNTPLVSNDTAVHLCNVRVTPSLLPQLWS